MARAIASSSVLSKGGIDRTGGRRSPPGRCACRGRHVGKDRRTDEEPPPPAPRGRGAARRRAGRPRRGPRGSAPATFCSHWAGADQRADMGAGATRQVHRDGGPRKSLLCSADLGIGRRFSSIRVGHCRLAGVLETAEDPAPDGLRRRASRRSGSRHLPPSSASPALAVGPRPGQWPCPATGPDPVKADHVDAGMGAEGGAQRPARHRSRG